MTACGVIGNSNRGTQIKQVVFNNNLLVSTAQQLDIFIAMMVLGLGGWTNTGIRGQQNRQTKFGRGDRGG